MQRQILALHHSRPVHQRAFRSVLIVLISVAIALLIQAAINHVAHRPLVFCLIVPVVAIAWLHGLRFALLTSLLSIVAIDFFLFEPHFAFDLGNKNDMVTLLAYSAISIPGAWVFAKLATRTQMLQLAQSELEMTLKSIGDAVLVVDRNRNVSFLNPIAERLTGWKLEEARDRNINEVFRIINETSREQAENPIERVFSEGNIVGLANHTVLISRDGTEYQIEDSAAPIRIFERDAVVGVVLVFRDVSTKYAIERKMGEALNTLEAVVSELSDGIVFTGPTGENVRMNKAALEMHGFSSEREMFDHFHKYRNVFELRDLQNRLIPEKDWPIAKVLRGERFHVYEAIVSRDDTGHSFTASYSGTPILDSKGNVKLAVITVRDISERAKATAELRRAKEEAEQASNLKTAFLANMSHEIRTPMTAVLGFTEVLRNSSLNEAERQDAISRIDRSGRSLLKLIDDLLDVSKIEAGKIDVQKARFSPLEITSEVISLLRIQADQKGVELRMKIANDLPDLACSDPLRVRQILTNLIGNALKFTSQGFIEVSVSTHGPDLVFEVADTGIGISETDQKKLFQPFAQADGSITRRFGGTGLGLVLSRDIARALGGNLGLVESRQNQGSKFAAWIPAAPFETSKQGQATSPAAKVANQTAVSDKLLTGLIVLVAEDVADNQELLRIYLTGAGAQRIDFAANGEEAVAKAMSRSYDLVLMDIQMPGMDGLQATKRLRELGYARPIVALTAHAMPEEVQNTLNAGCDGHIAKPISKDVLIRAVAEYARMSNRN